MINSYDNNNNKIVYLSNELFLNYYHYKSFEYITYTTDHKHTQAYSLTHTRSHTHIYIHTHRNMHFYRQKKMLTIINKIFIVDKLFQVYLFFLIKERITCAKTFFLVLEEKKYGEFYAHTIRTTVN